VATKLTAENLVSEIGLLSKGVGHGYVLSRNKGRIEVVRIDGPEGPIVFKRYSPAKGKTSKTAKEGTISVEMIWRVANALSSGQPVNLDRILGGSYNTRSVLEALLAKTPEFYMCYPKRVQQSGDTVEIEKGHKHLWWQPDLPHKLGKVEWLETEKVVSEVPVNDATYEAIVIPNDPLKAAPSDIDRRHAQIQIALIAIGHALGFANSVAVEDLHITYQGKKLLELESVVKDLTSLPQISSYPLAIKKLKHVDIVWFKNGKLMPAAIEVEHSTGIKSGLDRLKGLKDELPAYAIRYVIVADDSERKRVVEFSNEQRFKDLKVRFFSYSAVEELYSLCMRRTLRGVTEEFIDSFMEPL
jgi:type II restriction enzyme